MAAAALNLGVPAVGLTSRAAIPAARLNYRLCSEIRFGGCDLRHRIVKHHRLSCFPVNNSPSISMPSLEEGNNNGLIPTPIVVIDQDSDLDATVVEITFGDRLGALRDTMKALKDLGLNVVKGSALTDSSGIHNKFSITLADTGRKVENPELLEAIRLTIISNLLKYHPESSIQLAMGEAFGIMPPKEKPDVDIATHINIYSDDLKRRSRGYYENWSEFKRKRELNPAGPDCRLKLVSCLLLPFSLQLL